MQHEWAAAPGYIAVLLKAWWRAYRLLLRLPLLLRDSTVYKMPQRFERGASFDAEVDASVITEMDGIFNGAKKAMADYPSAFGEPYRTVILVALRTVIMAALAAGMLTRWHALLIFCTAQMLVCPLAIASVVASMPVLGLEVAASYAVNWPLALIFNFTMPQQVVDWTCFTLRIEHIVLYCAYDVALSLLCLGGWFVPVDAKNVRSITARDAVWGFFNTTLTIAFMIQMALGTTFAIPTQILSHALDLPAKFNAVLYGLIGADWDAGMYVLHRLSHLPHLYEQAHKNHHFGPVNPFNYNFGVQEQSGELVVEALLANALNIVPHYFSLRVWHNLLSFKFEHLCFADGSDGTNDHAMHHTHPNRHYCYVANGLDVLFGTNSDGNTTALPLGYELTKTDVVGAQGKRVRLSFTKRRDASAYRFSFA